MTSTGRWWCTSASTALCRRPAAAADYERTMSQRRHAIPACLGVRTNEKPGTGAPTPLGSSLSRDLASTRRIELTRAMFLVGTPGHRRDDRSECHETPYNYVPASRCTRQHGTR